MKSLFNFLVCACLFGHTIANAQTNVSGGIYSNTTWSLSASPYIVTGSVVIFPGVLLTIEPGVEVRFSGYYDIEIRGGLSAIGTANDSIIFCYNGTPAKKAWNCLEILGSTHNGYGYFEYCRISDADKGIWTECCQGNTTSYVKHSSFLNNAVGLDNYSGWMFPVSYSHFENNTIGAEDADKKFDHCTFRYNGTGLKGQRLIVTACLFEFNNNALGNPFLSVAASTVQACTISNNTLGISAACVVLNNTITTNSIGLLSHYWATSPPYDVPVKYNRICGNTTYNVKQAKAGNASFIENCFCADSATIDNLIYDGYDDISQGLVNFSVYDSTCSTVLRHIYKAGSPVTVGAQDLAARDIMRVYPSPFNDEINIQLPSGLERDVQIISALGQTVWQGRVSGNSLIPASGLTAGVYLVQMCQGETVLETMRIVK